MRTPLSWLREYVDIDLSPEELATALALSGTEVERVLSEGVERDEEILARFVVGHVDRCEKHPNADRLSVCTVDVGEDHPRTIVCGAPNVAAGQKVAVSLPGAVLPGGMEIGETELRGVSSSGMILSEAELGFETESPGIMILPGSWSPGDRLHSRLPIADDVLEIEVTPNRADCLSVLGIAREVAAVTGEALKDVEEPQFSFSRRQTKEEISVEVWNPELCPRYAARVIRGVKIGESPPWLKARLTWAGMRPINNVVDVTNYVMWSLGQPLHAFDLSTIRGRRVIARRAEDGEKIVTLDGVERTLTQEMLVIADAERASVIAGIMGSEDSEVTEGTEDLLLEAANFEPASILRTSWSLGLRSESSTRFEKGLDRNLIPQALDFACSLLAELCCGEVSNGTVDVSAGNVEPWEIRLRPRRVQDVAGKLIEEQEIVATLQSLGCSVSGGGEDLKVVIPTFRPDLEREIDLVEEVVRVHGLNRLPSTLPCRRAGRGGLTEDQRRVREIEDALRSCGLSEVITYTFGSRDWPDNLRLPAGDPRRDAVTLSNPLSSEQAAMRTTLLPGLLQSSAHNRSVREGSVHVYEVGDVFGLRDSEYEESMHLGLLLSGPWGEESWLESRTPVDYFLGKGFVERVFGVLGLEADYLFTAEPFLHPGKSAVIRTEGAAVGWLGEVHPEVLQIFGVDTVAVAAELDLGMLQGMVGESRVYEDLVNYPAVEQDIALVVDHALPSSDLVAAVRRCGGELLRGASVFDVYVGSQVPKDKKSLALRLVFRSGVRTLSESEVNGARDAMLERLSDELGAELRS